MTERQFEDLECLRQHVWERACRDLRQAAMVDWLLYGLAAVVGAIAVWMCVAW
jgi:fumarate reductase subunit D